MATFSEKPCLVETKQGFFSILYKNKYLYSKYQPKAVLEKIINSTVFTQNTLILLASPVLGYGIQEILTKMPKSSFLLAVERDVELFKFSREFITTDCTNFKYIHSSSVNNIIQTIVDIQNFSFRNVIFIEGSGGANLYSKFYKNVLHYAQQAIAQNWVNRLTLIKMGHTYAGNFFKNLKQIVIKQSDIKDAGSLCISKPILIIGAGPSLDEHRDFIIRNRSRLYILCVDASIPSLLPTIQPDGVVILESQFWIDEAFIGAKKYNIPIFMDLTSSPRILKNIGKDVYLYFTEYTKANYLNNLKETNSLPKTFIPMGSVGLTAVSLALTIRSASTIPIFYTGLDFAWQAKFTHANESMQVKKIRNIQNRLTPIQSGAQLFPRNVQKIAQAENSIFTTSVLNGYYNLFQHSFIAESNFFELKSLRANPNAIGTVTAEKILQKNYDTRIKTENTNLKIKTLQEFLQQTKLELQKLKDCFTGKINLTDDEVIALLKHNDFLYIHFPDGDKKINLSTQFLNRVRIEIEYFLKFISV